MIEADVAIIGAGIAGVGAAFEIAPDASVVVLEQEREPAYHTTGRSAAMFLESYGGERVRALTSASRAAFENVGTLLRPRPLMWVANPDGGSAHDLAGGATMRAVEPAEALAMCPVLRPEWATGALVEPDAQEIDVLGLHQHFLGGARRRGVRVEVNARVLGGQHDGTAWHLETAAGPVLARSVVDAAGAWADVVAALLGVAPVGLTPLVRTALVARCTAVDPGWPLVGDRGETFYFRPEGTGVLVSPADETPSEPHDARPDDLTVALALDRVNAATTLNLRSVHTAWAGLRTFAPDRDPVVGADPDHPSFCWLAGLGGFGIQTAPALTRLAADAVRASAAAAPDPVPASLSPARFR
jgi:D-arginine dehydrogenase